MEFLCELMVKLITQTGDSLRQFFAPLYYSNNIVDIMSQIDIIISMRTLNKVM